MERGDLMKVGRELMSEGARIAAEALTKPAGRQRRDAIAEASHHITAAMGMAILADRNPFEERDDV